MTRSIETAIEEVKAFKDAKFAERMEAHVRLHPPKKGGDRVRGSFLFPCDPGRERRVICFAEGPAAASAEAAGAVAVGGQALAERVLGGWTEFDAVVAHPAAMRYVGRLGKALGPRNLMPNPKEGSITPNVAEAVEAFRTRRARLREDDGGNLHVVFGLKAMPTERLAENLGALLEHLGEIAPKRIRRVKISSTMSRSVEVDVGG